MGTAVCRGTSGHDKTMALTDEEKEDFQKMLLSRICDVEEALENPDDKEVIAPDKAIGRLSRLDSMQMQEMARAQRRRREQELSRLRDALRRVLDGSYGLCTHCGGPIPKGRLEMQPEAALCMSCATEHGRER